MSRRDFIEISLKGAAGAMLLGAQTMEAGAQPAPDGAPNVLFIPVDDLRPQLACFGHEQMISPNIDRLAAEGTAFLRTHCQQAVCAPSRASLLSGLRPDSTRVWDLQTLLHETRPEVLTLPQHFRANGYSAISLGKVYHHRVADDPEGWSDEPWAPPHAFPGHASEELREKKQQTMREARERGERWRWRGPATEALDLPDNAYGDGMLTERALEEMRRLARAPEPFFLAVGYVRPHLAFACPKRYWDIYPPESIDLAENPFRPQDCPDIALHNWGELRAYSDIPREGDLSEEKARELIHGYYACTTFIDTQVGMLLDELERLGLRESTVVCLWGDHGWQLGEHGLWCKHTNFETSTHSPLVISAPGQRAAGQPTEALCEFVDIYPTLCELCGLEMPDHLEGVSLAPLMDDPEREWKSAAFSQYPRGRAMGYSMRTDRYRYTQWQGEDEVVAQELYDHQEDPGENVNLAGRPESAGVVQELSAMLEAGWEAALPPA
ncbi:MAG: sulfatase [Armatimonadota bacterium]|nr:sulfatase [Armatimonadota bacterium]